MLIPTGRERALLRGAAVYRHRVGFSCCLSFFSTFLEPSEIYILSKMVPKSLLKWTLKEPFREVF